MREIGFFSSKDTAFLKSIGIILMVVGHTFTEKWYIDSIKYPVTDAYFVYVRNFMEFAVVPLFAFITGYAYALKNDGKYKYVFRKITTFLINYYLLCLTMIAIAAVYCGYYPNLMDILKMMYPISSDLEIFAWYVPFYIEAMLLLPIVKNTVEKYGSKKSLYIIIVMYILMEIILGGLKSLGYREYALFVAVQAFKRHIPFVIMGFFFFKEAVFEKVLEYLKKKKLNINRACIITLIAIILLSIINDKIIGLKSGIIYTPIYIFCVVSLRKSVLENVLVTKVYELLAKHSMNIWILHGIFFSGVTRDVFQPIAFLPGNLLLVVVWIILISLVISLLITPIQKICKRIC